MEISHRSPIINQENLYETIDAAAKDPNTLIALFESVCSSESIWHPANQDNFNRLFEKIKELDSTKQFDQEQTDKITTIITQIYPSLQVDESKSMNILFFEKHLNEANVYRYLKLAIEIKNHDCIDKCLNFISVQTRLKLTSDANSPLIIETASLYEEQAKAIKALSDVYKGKIVINLKNLIYDDLVFKEFLEIHGKNIQSFQPYADFNNRDKNIELVIRSCPNLQYLNIKGQHNFWELRNLSTLKNLKEFILSENGTLEELPDLSKCINLQKLSLNCSKLVSLPSLNGSNLKEIHLLGCYALNDFSALRDYTNLEALSLPNLLNNNNEPIDFSVFTNLQNLSIKNSKELDKISINCPSLKDLKIETRYLEEIPDLSLLTSLQNLHISCGSLTEFPDLSNLKNLQNLKVLAPNVKTLSGLISCTILKNLDLSCNSLTELPDLSKFKSLQTIILIGCNMLKEIPGLGGCENLKELSLSKCSFKELPDLSDCKDLQKFFLHDCKNLQKIHGLSGCSNLEVLSIYLCGNFKELPELSGCKNLLNLALLCGSLRELPNLSGCKKLLMLDLSGCKINDLPIFTKQLQKDEKNNFSNQSFAPIKLFDFFRSISSCDFPSLKKLITLFFEPQYIELVQPFLNDIENEDEWFVKAKMELIMVVLGFLQEKALTPDEFKANRNLLKTLLNFRDPDLRNRLTTSWLFLYKEKNQKNLEKWCELRPAEGTDPNAMFTPLVFSSLIPEFPDLEKYLLNLKGKYWTDSKKLRILLNSVLLIQEDSFFENKQKNEILKTALDGKTNQDRLNSLTTFRPLILLKQKQKLIQCKKSEDFQILLEETFKESFKLTKIDGFFDKYKKTLGNPQFFRGFGELLTYLAVLKTLPTFEQEKVLPLLMAFVKAVLEGTFPQIRYEENNQSHLTSVFKDKDLKSNWCQGEAVKADELIPDLKVKTKSDEQQIDFVKFLNEKLLLDKHLGGETQAVDYPHLTEGLKLSAKEIKPLIDKIDKLMADNTNPNIAKMLKIERAILILPHKSLSLAQAQQELKELETFLPECLFKNDLKEILNRRIEEKVSRNYNKWIVKDTDDAADLVLMGTEIQGSCQAFTSLLILINAC